MGKTLILSQEQINEIIGGNMNYLDQFGKDNREYNGHNEVSVGHETGKEFSDQLGKSSNWYNNSNSFRGAHTVAPMLEKYSKRDFENMVLQETNKALDNIPINSVVTNPTNPNDVQQFQNTENSANVKASKLRKKVKENPNDEISKAKLNSVTKALDTQRGIVKRRKKINTEMGMTNQYQEKGGTKNGIGTAHTKKNNNGITYFN